MIAMPAQARKYRAVMKGLRRVALGSAY